MKYYFAPLEGLTDSIYRKLHYAYFPGIDRYYTPFLSPTVHRTLTPKESRELPAPDALGYEAVPQLLTKNPDDFLWMAQQCCDLGYRQINLNLGCPSGTVTGKGKGAAMLADPDSLDRFLDTVFSACPISISVKTRIGMHDSGEFPRIIEIFNKYPIQELIIHPRIRDVFYNGDIDLDAFRYAVENCRHPLCFNGNLCTLEQIQQFRENFPAVDAVMLGRGLIGDPGMLSPGGTTIGTLMAFYDALLEAYIAAFGGSRNAMFRLKEHWRHLLCRFESNEKLTKQLRKTTDLEQYKSITREIFTTVPLRETLLPDW